MKEEIINAIAEIISVSPEELSKNPGSYGLSSPPSWDSLAHLGIMSALETLLEIDISVEDMQELNDLEKILAKVEG